MKDKDDNHFSLPFDCGGCDGAFLAKCYLDYQAVASYKRHKDGQLQPDNFMKAVTTNINKHLPPFDVHPLQALRIMLLEKYYQLGEKWCKPGVCFHTTCSYQVRYKDTKIIITNMHSSPCSNLLGV